MRSDEPAHRLVVLGASNLTRGILAVVEAAAQQWGEPLEVFGALGLGRSYGMRTSIFARTLPGIVDCRIWPALRERPACPTRAVLSDVGNDILYGVPVETILGWVDTCLGRLRALEAEVVVTDLPLASIRRLGEARFLFFRSLLVPRSRLTLAQVAERAERVTDGLLALSARHGARFFRLRSEWYGFDPIHIRPGLWRDAWQAILVGEGATVRPAVSVRRFPRWLRLLAVIPEQRWLFGLERRRRQPALTMGKSTSVWLY